MINMRFNQPTGSKLLISIEQLATGLFFDFTPGSTGFKATPALKTLAIAEDAVPNLGVFSLSWPDAQTLPTIFPDGAYVVYLYDAGKYVAGEAALSGCGIYWIGMRNGDDGTKGPASMILSVPAFSLPVALG